MPLQELYGVCAPEQKIACRQDTLVRDPFYEEVPKFFGMSLKELYSAKHPTAWVEFERGEISEEILVSRFFRDSRAFDSEGMKLAMVSPSFVNANHPKDVKVPSTAPRPSAGLPLLLFEPVPYSAAVQTTVGRCCASCCLTRAADTLLSTAHMQLEACHYLEGMQQLLAELADRGVRMHAMSNYPVWYQAINAKLQIDR